MTDYEIFPNELSLLREGDYKFLVVSKTSNENDTLIIFADVKTRHSIQLYAWMKENDLIEAYTFGGGRMSVSCMEKIMCVNLFGTSSDYNFTSKRLVKQILQKSNISEAIFDLDLSTTDIEEPRITSFRKRYFQNP